MRKIKFFIVLLFFLTALVNCNDYSKKKGKKGDFSFRKCTSCNITDN